MQRVGLTGNIGSGKSLVAQIFKTFGVPVFEADLEAKSILFKPDVSQKVIRLFGDKILTDGSIDKKKLARVVFNDKVSLQKLNGIIHPAVRAGFETWAKSNKNAPYLIYEAAILFESGHYNNLDAVIVVLSDPETRIRRVVRRDGATRKEIMTRMQNQWPDDWKKDLADYVIVNNDQKLLIPQVEKIHLQIESIEGR